MKHKTLKQPFPIWLHGVTEEGTPALDCYGVSVLHSLTQYSDWYHPVILSDPAESVVVSREEYEAQQAQIAKLEQERQDLRASEKFHREEYQRREEFLGCLVLAKAELEQERDALRALAAQQAEDGGLWFDTAYAPEAYLQQALRKLHAAIEGDKPNA